MRTRTLLGLIAVLLLILAIWLVPLALAGGSAPAGAKAAAESSGTQCPFLQAHPRLDPHGSGGGAGTSTGSSSPAVYY
jgi:hypothetical protein